MESLLSQGLAVLGIVAHVVRSAYEILKHTRVRLDQAKQLLSETDRKVTNIASSVGFSTPSHFTRVCRSREGLSLNAFRLNSRKTGRLS